MSYLLSAKKLRVAIKRHLFAIRDDLWDRAKDLDAFGDPAYRGARSTLNEVIALAHKLDSFTFAVTRTQGEAEEKADLLQASDARVQPAITESYRLAYLRVRQYVKWDRPFSGILLVTLLRALWSIRRVLRATTAAAFYPVINKIRNVKPATARDWFAVHGPRYLQRDEQQSFDPRAKKVTLAAPRSS